MIDIIPVLQNAIAVEPGIAAIQEARVYPAQLPDAATYPATVLTKVSGYGGRTMDGETEFEESRVQVDVFAQGYSECVTLAGLVRAFIVGDPSPGPACVINNARCINDQDLPAPAYERAGPRLRRRSMEFSIWSRRI